MSALEEIMEFVWFLAVNLMFLAGWAAVGLVNPRTGEVAWGPRR